jgi:hypothetical protein
MVQAALHLTAQASMIRGIAVTALLIGAAFYSLQVLPSDLRLILARVVPLLSSRLAAILK